MRTTVGASACLFFWGGIVLSFSKHLLPLTGAETPVLNIRQSQMTWGSSKWLIEFSKADVSAIEKLTKCLLGANRQS